MSNDYHPAIRPGDSARFDTLLGRTAVQSGVQPLDHRYTYIHCRHLTPPGMKPRTQTVHMNFEGPAPKSYVEGDSAVAKGQLDPNWRMSIPPGGICDVPDTQANREKLRKMTVGGMSETMIEVKNPETRKWEKIVKKHETYPAFEILDGTDISIDLESVAVSKTDFESGNDKIKALEAKVKELESIRVEPPMVEEPMSIEVAQEIADSIPLEAVVLPVEVKKKTRTRRKPAKAVTE